ncbi:MAG: hypothetical protein H0X63_11695 [Flavobacteriales bacterium]|nr:hypothetical protein [Flavobacteriales bacterium]
MIYESYYWKKELLTLADKLHKRTKSKRWWTEAQHGTFEKEVMIGFYIIRKLIEAKTKLTNALVATKFKGIKYPNNGKKVTWRNNHRFHECYDFEKPLTSKYDIIFLCNQFVHSYIFSPCFSSEDESENSPMTLSSIHFSSDDKRNDWLFEISIESVIKIFKDIGNDYPSSSHQHYDPRKGDWKIINGNEKMELSKKIEEIITKHEK